MRHHPEKIRRAEKKKPTVKIRKLSLSAQTITPSIGPSKKDMSRIKALPKSSFKKGVAGKIGKSKRLTVYESATNTAISDARFAVNRFLRSVFGGCKFVELVPAPVFSCSFIVITPIKNRSE